MDASLQRDLARAPLPGLLGPIDDLISVHQIRVATQIQALRTLRKRTEPAFEIAHVGVVDVPVDDVADRVSLGASPKLVGREGNCIDLVATSPEQPLHLISGRWPTRQ